MLGDVKRTPPQYSAYTVPTAASKKPAGLLIEHVVCLDVPANVKSPEDEIFVFSAESGKTKDAFYKVCRFPLWSRRKMRHTIWTFSTLCITTLALGAAIQAPPELPEGSGKTVLETACVSCHGSDVIAKREGLRSESWMMIVEQMKQYGANITGDQSEVLVRYLADNFGEGRKILDTSCTTCHGLNEVKKFQGFYKRDDWKDVVTTMVKYGALVKEAQVPVLVDYLTRAYGPKN